MANSWQGLLYVRDDVISLGAVTHEIGVGLWAAVKCDIDRGQVPLGGYLTVEEAQAAVERAC